MNFNDDITKVKSGGRIAKKISVNDFKEKLFAFIDKYEPGELIYKEFIQSNNPIDCRTKCGSVLAWFIYAIQKDKMVSKDLSKISFGYDIVDAINNNESQFLGLNVTENGMPFIGVSSCGDDEFPEIYFIIYFDGKNMRGYIPYYGNTYNPQTKAAFSAYNEDEDNQFLKPFGKDIDDLAELCADEAKLLFDINNRIVIVS